VLVAGASGFIGSALAARLAATGVAFDALVRSGADVPGAERTFRGDVRDAEIVRRSIAHSDVVFALAGLSGASASVRDPFASLDVNAAGFLTLLEASANARRMPRIVFPSSRLVYGPVDRVPVAEDAPTRPNSPYGLHKLFCEQYAALFARRYGLRYAVARLTNPYGATSARAGAPYNVLGALAARATAGEPLTIYGDGLQIRDYLAIDDALDGLALLAAGAADGTIVNLGSGDGITFADAVGRLAQATGAEVRSVPWPEADLSVETGSFVADITVARSLGFAPRIGFDTGLAAMLAQLRR
jgi:UDP-glucose 4-epimerase